MSKGKVIARSSVPKQPKYTVQDKKLGSAIETCPLKQKENASKEKKKQKLVKASYTDEKGNALKEITIEKEIYLVIESENMAGETVLIELPFEDDLIEVNGEKVDSDKLIKLPIGSNNEKVKLKLLR
jgi:hypothetical protein